MAILGKYRVFRTDELSFFLRFKLNTLRGGSRNYLKPRPKPSSEGASPTCQEKR